MQLLANDHTVMAIDALQVGERYFFSNVSVGLSRELSEHFRRSVVCRETR